MNSATPVPASHESGIVAPPASTDPATVATNQVLTPRANIGVLLVHGIGNHREGETLRAFGQPVLDWLKDWLRGKGGDQTRGTVSVSEARFSDPEAPAHALAEVKCRSASTEGETESARESWLFCEGWWGAMVQPPASFQLLRWMWTRGPLLIYWHFFNRQTAGKEKSQASPGDITFGLVAFLLAGFCQIVIGIAMLLSLIPIGPWRRKVIDAVRALTLTLGDSYVLEEDIQRAALVDRVRRALDWMAQRTDRVVVIAHSQGGAIAHEVLRQSSPNNLRMFVTVGSGLEKLHFLREVVTGREGLVTAWLIFPLAFAGASIASSGGEHWAIGLGIVFMFISLTLALGLVSLLGRYKERLKEAMPDLELPILGEKKWIDIYASDDVVPMDRGSVLTNARFVAREKVYNERSYVRDHVVYFTNVNDCLGVIWQKLAELSRLTLFAPGDGERLRHFASVHKGYAHVISFSRLALFLAIFLGGWVLRDPLLKFGKSVVDSTKGTVAEDWLKPIRGFAGIVASIIQRFAKSDSVTAEVLANALFGAMLLIGIIAFWWMMFRGFWRWRCLAQWRRACHGQDVYHNNVARARAWVACTILLGFGGLPLIVSITLVFRPEYLTAHSLGSLVAMSLGGVALLLACLFAGMAPWATEATWYDTKTPVYQRIAGAIGIVWIVYSMLLVFHWFLPGLDPALVALTPLLFGLVIAIAWQIFAVLKLRKAWHPILVAAIMAMPLVGAAASYLRRMTPSYTATIWLYLGLSGAVLLVVFLIRQLKWAGKPA
jgi:hypothetical protein